jgi:hypothetical protein
MDFLFTRRRRARGARAAAGESADSRAATVAGDTTDQRSKTRRAADDLGVSPLVGLALHREYVGSNAYRRAAPWGQ